MTDFTTITACGECCTGCSKKKEGICPGCIETDGCVPEWAESGRCKIHACCKEHNARFCGLCNEFPCENITRIISWNPDIVQYLSALGDEYMIQNFSDKYAVRVLSENDIPAVLTLCEKNKLYYQYCPPFVSEESIRDDMKALPPGKGKQDKFYIGFYDNEDLVAVMDLIMEFPDDKTIFIGFFMTDVSVQNKGVGSGIITELCDKLRQRGYLYVKLGWVKGNPQAEYFWKKNGFIETGAENTTKDYTVTIAQRKI